MAETAAGTFAVELDLLLIKENTAPTKTINATIPITKFLVPLSGLLLFDIALQYFQLKNDYLSNPNLPFGKR